MVSNEEQEPALSESLVGLVGAVDRLKETMGIEDQAESESMMQIESYVSGIRDENEELRRHAEEAITMAQKYKEAYEQLAEENSGLYEQLTQAKMGDMVSHAQELTAVAYEYDKEVVLTKVAQAEEMIAHAYAIQDRLEELEEENEALKQTLHEIREDQKQMHALRQLNATGLGDDAHDVAGIGEHEAVECGSPVVGSPRASGSAEHTPAGHGTGGGHNGGDSSTKKSYKEDDTISNASTSLYATPGSAVHSLHTTPKNEDPLAIADALAVVAGGSEAGMAASASKMLRGYHNMQSEVDELRSKNEALAKENEELTEMMTSKQFKAPSAWAEREVKHKLDQKEWEEQVRTRDATIKELEAEVTSLRTSQGTAGLEERIVDLEAQLVASRRECADAKTSLHELQVSSMMGAGEFSTAGVKPLQNSQDVHSIVDKIESESESSAMSGAAGGGAGKSRMDQAQLEEELANLKLEKAGIIDDLGAIQAEIAKGKVDAAKSEIALLENGVPVDIACKVIQLESESANENAIDEDIDGVTSSLDMSNAAADVADAVKDARRNVSIKGDEESMKLIDRLRVTSYIDGYGNIDTENGVGALAAPTVPQVEPSPEALDRIEQLKEDIIELNKVVSARTDHETGQTAGDANENAVERPSQGMPPRAAAALAAVNRSQTQDIERLRHQLTAASQREAELQEKITSMASAPAPLAPIRLDLNVGGSASTTSSAMTPIISPGRLAIARKDADQAWEDHQKKSDVGAILREKAQIEAKFDVTKSQLTKSQQALDMARQDAVAMKKAIKQAIATGDIKAVQKALEEASKSSSLKKTSSPLKRLKGRGIFSLKKSSQGSGSNGSSRPSSGESGEAPNLRLHTPTGAAVAGSNVFGRDKADEDEACIPREIENLTEENEMLMDQLVTAKVRLAEAEGECLQSRRALVRAREKQMELSKQLKEIRAGPLERG